MPLHADTACLEKHINTGKTQFTANTATEATNSKENLLTSRMNPVEPALPGNRWV